MFVFVTLSLSLSLSLSLTHTHTSSSFTQLPKILMVMPPSRLRGRIERDELCLIRVLLEVACSSELTIARRTALLGLAQARPIKRVVGQVHWRPSWTSSVRSIFDLLWSPLISLRSAFALCTASLHGRLHASSVPACYFTSFTGLRMHTGLSRPTHMGQLAWAGLDHARARGRPRWHALFKEPRPVMYMQRCLHRDPDLLKVHVHVHETRFTAQKISASCTAAPRTLAR